MVKKAPSEKFNHQKGSLHVQTRLKRCIFFSSLGKNSRQFVRFRWSGNLYKLLYLCFGLGPAPRIFTKLLKVPMTILSRINIKIIIYLDDTLLIGHSLEEILMSRDTVIFLLQHLGFVINWKKCVDTSAGNTVFGPDNQLCHPRTFFKQNKNSESSFRMSEFAKQSTSINSGVDKVDWLVGVNYSSSFSSNVELPFSPNAKTIIFIGKPFLFR